MILNARHREILVLHVLNSKVFEFALLHGQIPEDPLELQAKVVEDRLGRGTFEIVDVFGAHQLQGVKRICFGTPTTI